MPFTMSGGRGAVSEIKTEQTLPEINSEMHGLILLLVNIKIFPSNTTFDFYYWKIWSSYDSDVAACIL